MLAADIIARLESIAPRELAFDFDITGLICGDANRDVTTVGVSWNASRDALAYFGYITSTTQTLVPKTVLPEMLILHEYPFFDETNEYFPGLPFFSKFPNTNRLKGLLQNDTCVYVMSSNFDEADGGTADILARALGITVDSKIKSGRIGNIEPMTFMQMIQFVKNVLAVDVIRYVAGGTSANEKVSRIGLFIGYGLRNYDVIEQLALQGAEVIISTGLNSRTAVYLNELGIKAIDVEKKKMESPAMKFLAKWLETNFKDRLTIVSYDPEDVIFYA